MMPATLIYWLPIDMHIVGPCALGLCLRCTWMSGVFPLSIGMFMHSLLGPWYMAFPLWLPVVNVLACPSWFPPASISEPGHLPDQKADGQSVTMTFYTMCERSSICLSYVWMFLGLVSLRPGFSLLRVILKSSWVLIQYQYNKTFFSSTVVVSTHRLR